MITAARGRMAIRTHRVSPHDACPASPLAAAANIHARSGRSAGCALGNSRLALDAKNGMTRTAPVSQEMLRPASQNYAAQSVRTTWDYPWWPRAFLLCSPCTGTRHAVPKQMAAPHGWARSFGRAAVTGSNLSGWVKSAPDEPPKQAQRSAGSANTRRHGSPRERDPR